MEVKLIALETGKTYRSYYPGDNFLSKFEITFFVKYRSNDKSLVEILSPKNVASVDDIILFHGSPIAERARMVD